LSSIDGILQTLRFPRKGKFDLVRTRRSFHGHAEESNVERGSQIVDGVTENKREGFWYGAVGFGEYFQLSSLALISDHELEWTLREEGIHSPVEIVDVMYGPLNFEIGLVS
jgi:hypothetical protein